MRIISIEIDGDDIVFMEETEHENLFHLIKIKKIYVEKLLDKLGYVKEETEMNLYDEAIETIDNIYMCVKSNGDYDDNCVDNNLQGVRKALKRAEKEHELLELYKELSFIRKFEYKKQEPSETEKLCMKQIKALEEELK